MANVRPRKTRVSCAVFFQLHFPDRTCTKHLRGGLPRANYCWITHGRSWQTQMLIAHYVPIILVAPAHQCNPWNNKLPWNMVSPPLPIETRCANKWDYTSIIRYSRKANMEGPSSKIDHESNWWFPIKKNKLNNFQHKIKNKKIQHNSIDGGFLGYHPRSDPEIIHHTCTWIHQ